MIKFNNVLYKVNRVRSRYASTDLLRLHASERDLAFDQQLWDCFVSSLTQEDIRYYPNVDKAYDIVAQMTGINKECLSLAEGSDRILTNIFQCFALRGFNVVSTNPCFPMYKIYAQLQGSTFVGVDYKTDKFPFNEFVESIDEQASLVIISNPSSPVGDTLTIEQLTKIADRCKHYGCILAVDEAYIEFSDVESAVSLIDEYNLIVIRTFSKAHGAAGTRIGYSVSNLAIKNCLNKVASMNELSGLSVKWLEAMFSYDDTVKYVGLVKQHRLSLIDTLIKCNVKYIDSQTNYVNIQGNIKLDGILSKTATMPWDGLEYTRVSVPADETNFMKLISEVSKL
jgi:histidinol-phosphate aminotransferase